MKILSSLMLLILLPVASLAGTIYGSIQVDGHPANATIEITLGGKKYSGRTDENGAYHIYVDREGPCRLVLASWEGQPGADITSYGDPARYDFELRRTGDGWVLVRR
jgi:hypothetical protein